MLSDILDLLEKILQRRIDTAFVVEMDDEKANIDAELLQIVKELRNAETETEPPSTAS